MLCNTEDILAGDTADSMKIYSRKKVVEDYSLKAMKRVRQTLYMQMKAATLDNINIWLVSGRAAVQAQDLLKR